MLRVLNKTIYQFTARYIIHFLLVFIEFIPITKTTRVNVSGKFWSDDAYFSFTKFIVARNNVKVLLKVKSANKYMTVFGYAFWLGHISKCNSMQCVECGLGHPFHFAMSLANGLLLSSIFMACYWLCAVPNKGYNL